MKTKYLRLSHFEKLTLGKWCLETKNFFEKNVPQKIFQSITLEDGTSLPILVNSRNAGSRFNSFRSRLVEKIFNGPIRSSFYQSYRLSSIFLLDIVVQDDLKTWASSAELVLSYLLAGTTNLGLTPKCAPTISG